MNIRRSVVGAVGAAALGLVALSGSPALATGDPTDAATTSSTVTSTSVALAAPAAQGYVPGSRDDAQNDLLRSQLAQALASAEADSTDAAAAATVVYDASQAPSFASEIATAVSIWNSSVSNVQFVQGSGATLDFYEGDDPSGSYAYSDGRGTGYVFLDYAQTQQYDVQRVVTHEIGHTIGLPDTYDGPCSELMSGGGPGPSCTNSYPNSSEVSQVDAIWAGSAVAANPLALAAFR